MEEKILLNKNQEYMTIELLTWDQAEEASALRNLVYEEIENKNLYASATKADFKKSIDDGFGLACMVKGKMVACLLCTLERVEYGEDRKYEKKILDVCADYVDIFVHPRYRGNGIQNRLENVMAKICREKGKKIILGTVSPDNLHSYQNFIKSGYIEVDRMEKYGGLDRILMEKRLD